MRKLCTVLLIAILFGSILTACNPSNQIATDPETLAKINASSEPGGWKERHASFAFSLYQELVSNHSIEAENVLISPASIGIALAMATAGAEGETKEAMLELLHMQGVDEQELNLYFAKLLQELGSEENDSGVVMDIANSFWMREGTAFLEDYTDDIHQYFQAEARELDFDQANAADTINQWVSDKTNEKIKSIVEPPIDEETMAYLINAIYFNGTWSNTFDPDLTKEDTFYSNDGEVNHPFMEKKDDFLYLENEQLQMISLPYGDGRYSMMILLPAVSSDINDFIASLNSSQWNQWLNELEDMEGTIKLPKFQLEYDISLVDALDELGMGIAFDEKRADFSNMVDTSQLEIFISDVRHKTFIDVNEEGTEAAAVTSVKFELQSGKVSLFEPFVMEVNRPFFYVIYDRQTDSFMFMGEVHEPALENK